MDENQTAAADDSSSYESLVEFLYLAPVGILKFAPDGKIAMANPMATQLLMPLSRDHALWNIYRLFAESMPDLRTRIESFRAPAGAVFDQVQVAVPGTRSILTLGVNKIDPDTLMAVVQDISLAIERETRIRDDQQRFRAIFDNVRDYAIYMVDLSGRIEEWNRSLHRLGGWQPADIAGASFNVFFPSGQFLIGQDDDACGAALLDRAWRNGAAEFEGWCVRKDGSSFWGNTVATALPDREGSPNGYVLVTRDLTERKQIEDRLLTLATTDPMTGASNRRAGEARLAEEFARWRRYSSGFAVLMIDVDHFKKINDRWGHAVGDDVLISLMRVIRGIMRAADFAVRWGGEEFLMLLPETGTDTARAVAERLRAAIEAATVEHGGGGIAIKVSIGAATVGNADKGADEVVRRADMALYRAKETGRNRVIMD